MVSTPLRVIYRAELRYVMLMHFIEFILTVKLNISNKEELILSSTFIDRWNNEQTTSPIIAAFVTV